MKKNRYEIVYILKTSFEDFTTLEKKITAFFPEDKPIFKSLGKKKFGQPIKKEKKGHYYQLNVTTTPVNFKKFLQEIKWITEIVRYLAINLEKEKYFSHSQKKFASDWRHRTREFKARPSVFTSPKENKPSPENKSSPSKESEQKQD